MRDSALFEESIKYIFGEFLPGSENAMSMVEEELRGFGERGMSSCHNNTIAAKKCEIIIALPMFLADEKERATTRYVNITTIATFFSSVTATALQMSISFTPSVLGDTVNFFWFTSLVFSVSSGVCSLLGMTWRKSSM